LTQIRVVLVGGEDSDRDALDSVLRDAGFPSVRFLEPSEAIAAMSAHTVDLLMIDVMQTSHDVLALMKTAAEVELNGERIPVIVTAPSHAVSRITACLQRGADDYLMTPLDPGHPLVITRRIQQCVHRHHGRPPVAGMPAGETRAVPVARRSGGVAAEDAAVRAAQAHRFLPRDFLDMLAKESIADVRLGDHIEREMSVLFSDIRNFTHLSESLTPQQNFGFLTSYLRNVTPIIRRHGGFVDKYLGDGVMALFPGCADDVVRAAVDLLKQLDRYNLGRRVAGYVPIRVGMGVHRGPLMIGTIGAEDQMQTTVIADAVNLASRLEGMTKIFDVSILLSGAVVEALPHNHTYKLRGLGAVKAKGKSHSVEVYECFDNDPDDLMEHKLRTENYFNAAMAAFRKGQLLSAGSTFARIAEMHRDDKVAAYFRDRCALSVMKPRMNGAWDGAEHLEFK
jgi:class 3 adenylate cyclase